MSLLLLEPSELSAVRFTSSWDARLCVLSEGSLHLGASVCKDAVDCARLAKLRELTQGQNIVSRRMGRPALHLLQGCKAGDCNPEKSSVFAQLTRSLQGPTRVQWLCIRYDNDHAPRRGPACVELCPSTCQCRRCQGRCSWPLHLPDALRDLSGVCGEVAHPM
eukprot:CAMPEP_0179065630 /NCGR_PEP_ID=MMETSP0796-20121207/28561_1 /TAXON_ID=73915 /ORGANISM="Pyrodinium bahamense, Strain pbaha01" /LENGTH=162 /DNA_ID=CAMNT_0020762611 /DNA_START=24 /DNA_END=512 /DNA_ORIENTATION=-